MYSAVERTGIDERDFPGRESEYGAAAEDLAALLHDKRNTTAEADDASGVPATKDFVESLVAAAETVSLAKWQVIVEGTVENMSPVK